MAHPPAKCRNCSQIVPATGFNISNSFNVTFAGCVFLPCPLCGGVCDVLDGIYNFTAADVVELLSAPTSTYAILRQAAEAARLAKAAGETDEKALERATEVLPSLSILRSISGRAKQAAVFLAVQALVYLAQKMADPHVEPYTKGPERTDAQISALVKDAVAQALAEKEKASKAAGIQEPKNLRDSKNQTKEPAKRVGAATANVHPGNDGGPKFPMNMLKAARQAEKSDPAYKAIRAQAEAEYEASKAKQEHR